MLVGHFAAGFAARRIVPRVSLGTLVLAAMFADLAWTSLLLAGIETVQLGQGHGAAAYVKGFSAPWSHSLLGLVVAGAVLAGIWARTSTEAVVIGTLVVSHWFLDVLSHRPDMPLTPWQSDVYGLSLWTSVPWTLSVEGGMWLCGVILVVRCIGNSRARKIGFWSGVVALTLIWHNNIAGLPPASARAAATGSLITFSLFVAWSYWVESPRRSGT